MWALMKQIFALQEALSLCFRKKSDFVTKILRRADNSGIWVLVNLTGSAFFFFSECFLSLKDFLYLHKWEFRNSLRLEI